MEKMIFIRSLASCLLAISLTMCARVYPEVAGIEKKTVRQHNYIAITTNDGTPAELEINYSVLGQNGTNEVKTEKLFTPCLIGGENVLVTYDSILTKHHKEIVYTWLRLNRDFREEGADFLSIRNLSPSVMEYAVIGNQPLRFHNPFDLDRPFFNNTIDEKDMDKVVKLSPSPIHHSGVPVLYLLKPELSGVDSYYVIVTKGNCKYISGDYARKIEIGTTTYNLLEVVDFYRREYAVGGAVAQ